MWQASYTEPGASYGVQSETVDIDFVMEELRVTGFTDAKVSGAEPSFTNDTYQNILWLPNVKDKVTMTTDEVTEKEGGQRVFWQTSDENVATVNKKGVVTAVGEGSCTLTATLADGRQSVDVTVRVGPVDVTIYATGNLRGTADNGTVSLADVAALHADDPDSILLDAGGSVQGAANTSLTGGMDMLSSMNYAGYDLQVFGASDLAFGAERLVEDAAVTSGPSIASTLQNEDGTPLFYRSTSWSRNRITNGLQEVVQRAGKTIGFFSLENAGVYAHAQVSTAEQSQIASEQVAALRAKGAQAIVCVAGAETAVDAETLAGLGVNAVLTLNPDEATRTEHGLTILNAAGGLNSVAALTLTFGTDGSITAAAETVAAASLQAARSSLSADAQTAYDSTATGLTALAQGDESVRAQELFTFEENADADETISFGNFVAEVYLTYAEGSRDAWTAQAALQDAALAVTEDMTLTAVAGGVSELEYGAVTRGDLLDALPAGARLQLVCTTAEAVSQLLDTGSVAETYDDSLVPYYGEGNVLLITDTDTLANLSDQNYTILMDYGDVFWDIRMNINDRTENFAQPFVLPEAPQYGAGRNG